MVLSGTDMGWLRSMSLVALASGVHALVAAPAESGWLGKPAGCGRSDGVAPEAGKGPWVTSFERSHLVSSQHSGSPLVRSRGEDPRLLGLCRSPWLETGGLSCFGLSPAQNRGPCPQAFVKGQGLPFQGSINCWRIETTLRGCRLPTAACSGSL